jgi:hypothetical protein
MAHNECLFRSTYKIYLKSKKLAGIITIAQGSSTNLKVYQQSLAPTISLISLLCIKTCVQLIKSLEKKVNKLFFL